MSQRKLQAVLLIIIVILWNWTGMVTCDDDDDEPDRYFLTDMYNNIQYDFSSTGYESSGKIMTDEELNELPADELKAMVVNKMKEIECSFVYSSLYHLKVFRNILKTRGIRFFIAKLNLKVNHGHRRLRSQFYKLSNPLCFAVESKSMLTIVYHWKYSVSINAQWLCYVLHHDLSRLNQTVVSDRLANLTADLNDVQDYLETFTMQNCSKENKFNQEYEHSSYYEEFQSLNNMSVDKKEQLIVKNQEYVKGMLYFRFINTDDDIFEIDRIFINDVVWKDDIIGDLLERYARLDRWKQIREKMLHDYLKAFDDTASLRNRIKAIRLFQSKFIDLLEIIMLQSTWDHLTYLRKTLVSLAKQDCLPSRTIPKLLKDFEFSVFVRKFSKYLSQFVSYIGGSSHFNGVIDMLNKSHSNDSKKYAIDESELDDQINNVLTTLHQMHSSFYDCKPLFVEFKNQIVRPKEFVKFLKSTLWKMDFGVIRSFIRFSDEFETWTIEKDSLNGKRIDPSIDD